MIFVLLPVFNEEKNIEYVISDVSGVLTNLKENFLIVVVNDGSTDKTKEVLARISDAVPFKLINFKENKGINVVFKKGIMRICSEAKEDDILISMDCDRTHKAEAFRHLIEVIKEGSDIAIASRYHKKSKCLGLPFIRSFLSDGINWLLKMRFKLKGARDYTTFFRAYRIKILKKALDKYQDAFITQKGFCAMAEILIKLNALGVDLKEVPLELRFDLRLGKSKMKVFDAILGYLKMIFSFKI